MVSYPIHTVPGQAFLAVYQYLVHILSPVTDNCPSWISGRERMAVETFSWPISTHQDVKTIILCIIFIPRHKKKWRGIMLYPPNRLSVCPSVSASFPDSNLSSFWPIFFKLCKDIDTREEWFGIANGLNSFINNRVRALDWCKNVFFLNIFRTNGWILIQFCIWIDIYKIHVVSNAIYFGQFLTELWPLINVRILFILNVLWINLWISIKFCIWIDIDKV